MHYFPAGVALEILLLGEPITAEDGYRLRFINQVVSQQDVMSTAETYANKINEFSPLIAQSIKSAFYMGSNLSPQA